MTEADNSTARGGCLCGAVRYRVNAPMRKVINCHCGQCRRIHGHFAAYSAVAPDALELIREDGLKWYRSSEAAERGFCAECGASLFWKPEKREYVCIAAGTMDGPTRLRTAANIFCADAGDYYDIEDGLPRYDGSLAAGDHPWETD